MTAYHPLDQTLVRHRVRSLAASIADPQRVNERQVPGRLGGHEASLHCGKERIWLQHTAARSSSCDAVSIADLSDGGVSRYKLGDQRAPLPGGI